jgi:hypothetical protein
MGLISVGVWGLSVLGNRGIGEKIRESRGYITGTHENPWNMIVLPPGPVQKAATTDERPIDGPPESEEPVQQVELRFPV